MIVIYDIKLVLLSVLIAVLASYFALEVVRQIVVAQESVRKHSEETQPP
jgi:NO-binding membrane sensor protein with MHYT domain